MDAYMNLKKNDLTRRMIRIMDVTFSMIAIFLLFIPMVIVAFLIKTTSKGGVFFTQSRYGLNGNVFKIYKYRSMYACESKKKFKQATKNDIRVTKIGKFIRATSIDELPQLLNVIKGDMSLVGARPHPIALDDKFAKIIPNYMNRYKERPGITGLAQINNCRGETDTLEKMENRVKYDIEYSNNISIYLYFKILFLTPIVVIFNKNAY